MTEQEILKAVFREHNLTDDEASKLHSHIEEHKYYVNENVPFTITFDQAIFSWYDNIFREILNNCSSFIVKKAFPDYDCFQMYFFVMDHWHYLKKKNPAFGLYDFEPSIETAIKDYVKNFSQRKWFGKIFYPFI